MRREGSKYTLKENAFFQILTKKSTLRPKNNVDVFVIQNAFKMNVFPISKNGKENGDLTGGQNKKLMRFLGVSFADELFYTLIF